MQHKELLESLAALEGDKKDQITSKMGRTITVDALMLDVFVIARSESGGDSTVIALAPEQALRLAARLMRVAMEQM